jgi:hypothetical protein
MYPEYSEVMGMTNYKDAPENRVHLNFLSK